MAQRVSANTGIAYALAGAVVAAGVMVSALTGDWQWLSRGGALIVVIGIVLTSTQVLENARRLRSRRSHLDVKLKKAALGDAGTSAPSMHDWAGDMRALSRARRREEDTWEYERSGVYMLVAGTLIWGFGDLVGLAFS